jgi:uncharacterized iron-regulated protein
MTRVRPFWTALAAVALLLFAAGCLPRGSGSWLAPGPPKPDTAGLLGASGDPIPRSGFLRRAARADYILLGETHTNACDHRVQAKLIRWLAENGTRAAVGLEMVPATKQPVLDRFNAGRMGLDRLAQELRWKETWGHPYSLYRPVFRAVRDAGYPLFGLNVPRGMTESVRRKGLQGLDPAERDKLPERIILPPQAQKGMLTEEFEEHQEMLRRGNATSRGRKRFLQAQSVWDTAMASRASQIRARTGATIVILAGNGHVAFGWGIPHRLDILDPSARVLSVVGWRGLERPDPARGDLFFYCPLQHTSRLGFTLELAPEGGRITRVAKKGKARRAGLQSGDLLVRAGGKPFRELMDLHRAAVRAHKENKPLVLVVRRNGGRKRIRLEMGRK